MISRTGKRCKLCGKYLSFIEIGNGKYRCETSSCLCHKVTLILLDADEYNAMTKLQLLQWISKELEIEKTAIDLYIEDCEELIEKEVEHENK